MSQLLTFIFSMAEKIIPAFIWGLFLEKMDRLRAAQKQAELEKQYAENALKVTQANADKSPSDIVRDAIRDGKSIAKRKKPKG